MVSYLPRPCPLCSYTLVGLEQTAESVRLPDYRWPQRAVLVLGREKEGLPPEVRKACARIFAVRKGREDPAPLPTRVCHLVAVDSAGTQWLLQQQPCSGCHVKRDSEAQPAAVWVQRVVRPGHSRTECNYNRRNIHTPTLAAYGIVLPAAHPTPRASQFVPQVLSLLDVALEIPQRGIIRSLNVHVTGAIALYEYVRQQQQLPAAAAAVVVAP